jgi:LmbE family N-acetylglucosaminyl deacetylase
MASVLAIFAHPDDAEFLCAGTLIRLAHEQGYQVHIASMTPGDCGSAELPAEEISAIRRTEGERSAALLAGKYHCLEERDLLIFYQERTLVKVTRLLREVRPSIVLTHCPSDYLLDHEMTSQIVRGACFAAPVPNFAPDSELPPLERIPHLYYCDPIEGKDIFGRPVPAQFYVDISQAIELKTRMLACHASQREWLLKHHGMDEYLEAMKRWARQQGQRCGVEYAEGFRQHLGHSYPQDNLLGQLLGALYPPANGDRPGTT